MSNWNEVKIPWVKWSKIGDNIEGTLIEVREVNSMLPGKEGQRSKVYEIKADAGTYHETDAKKNPVEPGEKCTAGEVYLVGGRTGIDAQMKRIKIGQKVKLQFTEEKPAKTKGFNALKIIKVMTNGQMDEEFLASAKSEYPEA